MTDKDNVIRNKFLWKQAERSDQPGIRVLAGLPEQDLDDLFQFIFSLIEWEIKYGLGRIDWEPDENEEEPELYWFQHIQNIYNECNKDCYFCDDSVDPNETPYGANKDQWVCPECQLKLGSYLKYRGVPEAALKQLAPFSALGDRSVQVNKKGDE